MLIYVTLGMRIVFFFLSSRRRHTRLTCDWSADVCSSDLFRGEGDRGLIAVMTVGDVELGPAGERRELARGRPGHAPHADADAVELGARHRHAARGLRQGPGQSMVEVGSEQEDRLEAGP